MRTIPQHRWASSNNQRAFFDNLSKKLRIEKLDDWYKVKISEVKEARGLLKNYDGSLIKALQSIYSEHRWRPWKFLSVSHGFWNDRRNQRLFFDSLAD